MARIFKLPRNVLNAYTCRGTPILLPYPSDSVVKTGFVTLTLNKRSFLEGNNKARRITIGNKSYLEYKKGDTPGKPKAKLYGQNATLELAIDRPFIKSFRYGFTNTGSVEVVIIDSNGGEFAEFIRNIPETCAQMSNYVNYTVKCNYGWVYQDINMDMKEYDLKYTQNITYIPNPGDRKRGLPMDVGEYELTLMINSIQVANANGLWAYTLKMSDLTYSIKREENLRTDKDTPGTDENKVQLAPAVDQMMQQCGQKNDKESHFASVRVARPDTRNATNAGDPSLAPQGRVLQAFGFKKSDGGAKGPPNVYRADNQNSLDVIRSYANGLVSDQDKGMFFILDTKSTRPYLYIVENNFDLKPGEDECVAKPLAVYIVNGGSSSPVLGFDISINIQRQGSIGGVGPNATGPKIDAGDKPKDAGSDPENDGSKKVYGIETFIPVPADVTNFRAPKEANSKEYQAVFENSLASQMYESIGAFRGTLTLIGDPWYAFPIGICGQTISIIYIEAFSPGSKPGAGNNYVVSNGGVNPYISSKSWRIEAVTHEITEDGKFTTMLEVSKPGQTGIKR